MLYLFLSSWKYIVLLVILLVLSMELYFLTLPFTKSQNEWLFSLQEGFFLRYCLDSYEKCMYSILFLFYFFFLGCCRWEFYTDCICLNLFWAFLTVFSPFPKLITANFCVHTFWLGHPMCVHLYNLLITIIYLFK